MPDDRAAVVRCVLDSLACKHRWTLERAEELAGRRADVVHIVGGGAANPLLCQLTADLTGRPVLAGPVEATAVGNLLVQARAAGELASLAELRDVVARSLPPRRFEPHGVGRGRGRVRALPRRCWTAVTGSDIFCTRRASGEVSSVLIAERRRRLLEQVRDRGYVSFRELADALDISESTVRRDLRSMVVRRAAHARPAAASARARAARVRPTRHDRAPRRRPRVRAATVRPGAPQREAIAAAAAALVVPGSAILLGPGRTTTALARHLAAISHLTVVTNSITVTERAGRRAADRRAC